YRCFPHVVNIAVKAGLSQLTQLSVFDDEDLQETLNDSVRTDVVNRCRGLVSAIRKSGRRRDDLQASVDAVNALVDAETDLIDLDSAIPHLELITDVETRWSSTFFLIDRVLHLYPAIDHYLQSHQFVHEGLSPADLRVLADIRTFLVVPHAAQELVSAQKTSTLSVVLPIYEELLDLLHMAAESLPLIAPAINRSIKKLQEYLTLSRKSRLYALAI
ncbi:hypothetical protein CONPUDRAFT_32096, partial [Coniophora puteana RWD-64-598 SS2]